MKAFCFGSWRWCRAVLFVAILLTALPSGLHAGNHDDKNPRLAEVGSVVLYLPGITGNGTKVQPTPPVIAHFGGSPATIAPGSSSILSWQVTGATQVSISPGPDVVSGSSLAVSPATSTEYVLTASNGYQSVTAKTTVTVQPPAGKEFAGVVFDQDRFLEAADVATDDQGNIHYLFSAVSANDQTAKGWIYARCPATTLDGCDEPDHWQMVALGREDALAQMEVTADGRPRLWLKSTLSARPIFGYGECNLGCDQADNWHFVDVVHSQYWYPSLEELEYRHESFALDPQGRPRFVYFHYDDANPELHGMRYAFCNSNCTREAGWHSVRISSTQSLWRPALGFTSAGKPRIVASDLNTNKRIMYVQCDVDCEGTGNWPEVPLFGVPDGHISWSLAVDPTNGAVRAVYKASALSEIWMIWCPGDCLTVENWDGVSLTLSDAPGGRNPSLVLDGAGWPHIAYEYADSSHNGLGYLVCTSGCYTLSTAYEGVWEDKVVESNVTLLEQYPLWQPDGCKDSSWLSGLRPTLALDKAGRARFAFEADGYSYCNKGTKEDPWFYHGQYWGTSRLIFER